MKIFNSIFRTSSRSSTKQHRTSTTASVNNTVGVGGVPPPGVPSPSGLPTGPPPDASAVSGPGPAPTPGVAPEEPLPPGWEMRYDNYGRRYYVDHNNRYD